MNNKLNLAKYKRLAKYMQIVIKIFYVVSIVSIIITLIAGFLLAFTHISAANILSTKGGLSFSNDNVIAFKVDPQEVTAAALRPVFTSICFMASTVAMMLAVIFKQLELILGTVKNDTPFVAENSRRLTIIGVTLMVGAFVKRIGEALVASTIIDALKLSNMDVNYSADSNMIITGFIVLILAGVFKYGSYLQKEYDATV